MEQYPKNAEERIVYKFLFHFSEDCAKILQMGMYPDQA